jgi:peroxiredoxin Q/BCP
MALNKSSLAPVFIAETDEGNKISLNDFVGKWIVLYFYPKDNTPGCTQEACDFRDNMERITSVGAIVMGVSPDSAKSHAGFKTKQNLNFSLIADPDKNICNLYDVMGEKSMYGRKYLGVIRTTYIISPKGEIAEVISNVKVKGHVDEIIETLKALQK